MFWFLVTIFVSSLPFTVGTQSVYSCPLTPGLTGVLPGFNGGVGEICGTGSFLHYWTCCQDFPFECCLQFEVWAIVFFSVLLVILIAVGLFFLGRYISSRY
ncbi:hypothetical protein M3Y98_00651400 [Aphelenchoides besseyi]|nr:hypothetical protein M3Y98_00651400 [Aphelenchoides besseyi]KAI6208682.1 hypothetical protein M3Y96_00140800 [Aphelenchoides besseyi]